jgi:uncharacterized protein GlcG (DUF336 family)
MTRLTLETAERLAHAAIAAARSKALNPMSVCVVDASGRIKVALREDGSALAGVDIALGKARAALTFGCTSRQIADALADNPLAGPSVLAVLQGQVVLLAGGAPILDETGQAIGAIGAAGDSPDNDEAAVMGAVSG